MDGRETRAGPTAQTPALPSSHVDRARASNSSVAARAADDHSSPGDALQDPSARASRASSATERSSGSRTQVAGRARGAGRVARSHLGPVSSSRRMRSRSARSRSAMSSRPSGPRDHWGRRTSPPASVARSSGERATRRAVARRSLISAFGADHLICSRTIRVRITRQVCQRLCGSRRYPTAGLRDREHSRESRCRLLQPRSRRPGRPTPVSAGFECEPGCVGDAARRAPRAGIRRTNDDSDAAALTPPSSG
jgi:hypothetical protein